MEPTKKRKHIELSTDERLKKVDKLLDKKKKLNQVIYSLYNNITILKDQIGNINKEINYICPHEWVRDWETCSNDKTPKKCKHCDS